MAGVLAAGGLLEGLARGTAALPPSSPPLQALCQNLIQACTASQAAVGQAEQPDSGSRPHLVNAQSQTGGDSVWRDAAALACCQSWQVSAVACVLSELLAPHSP